ncbi:hypothetical protein D6D04_09409 [Aureobasidium pullulans]|nr:hypothetical protein D6D04_09409 [Aureobasidium pullulans]
MASVFPSLEGLLDKVKSHMGTDLIEKPEPLLSKALERFELLLDVNGTGDDTTVNAERSKSTNWGLILKDTLEFLQSHKELIQDGRGQASRVAEDLGVLIDIAHTKASKDGVDDKSYLMERVIQLATSLPNDSEIQSKLTGTIVKGYWDTLQHPPLVYLGDENGYRTADGSNNNYFSPKLGMAGTPYARSVVSTTMDRQYPDPSEVFDKLLARDGPPQEHPNKVSSMLFYMATIIIHDIFRTGDDSKDNPNPNYNVSSTSSYLDLAPLYGNSIEEQKAVRTMKDGMLKPDTFHEHHLLGFPPGVSAYLITFNRFHNYVAGELKRINEGGRFTLNPRYGNDAERQLDHDLFNVARLITCGMYVNIILGDYVRTILNMNYAPDSTWALDPRESFSDDFAPGTFLLGVGNQCSVEFNLIYRWHSTVSARDEKWSEEFFEKVFPGRDVSKLPLREFLAGLATWREELMKQKPEDRTFGDLKRDKDGHFDSTELAKIIAESTNDCSGLLFCVPRQKLTELTAAFGARQTPLVLKLITILGMHQARGWHVGTLNELRKFMQLTPHKSFRDINSDPDVQAALESLYKDPDLVEMYPGVVFEESKKPVYPGSGLCAGFTITRAILSDAVALTRGDRFYTLGWTPTVMTSWGFDLIKPNGPQDKLARGGKLHHLLDVAFPGFYKEKSVWKLFPMTTPDEIERIFTNQGVGDQYDFSSPL